MDDLISRQAAIEAILENEKVYSNNFGDDPIDKYTVAIIDNDAQTIANLPSAQPERKKGKWVEIKDRYGWYCSSCKCKNDYAYKWNESNLLTLQDNFCPNCGAEMER